MKFFCEQKDLLRALSVVSRAISQNTMLPVLNNFYIKAEGKKVIFIGTNLEIAMQYTIQADVRNEGVLTIPARVLTSFVSLLPDEKVEISATDNLSLFVKSKSDETKIKGINADEFPLIPTIEKITTFKVSTETLKTGIQQTAFAASSLTTRPVLSGVSLSAVKNEMRLTATDSYRLAEKKIPIKGKDIDFQCIVPAHTMHELGKTLDKDEDKEVEIIAGKNQILFQCGGLELTSRLIEGKYPEYEKIIPKTAKTTIELNTEALTRIIKRVGIFAREDNNSVRLSATHDGKVTISSTETKVGDEKAELDAKVDGENNKITVNAQYLLEVLMCINDEKTKLVLNDKFSPVMVQSLRGEDYVYIIMPLKV